jgi:putative endonuclease
MTTSPSQKTGQHGEALAIDYLCSNGYQIITQNWHCTYGEIDIVAQRQGPLVFVEVRSRHAETTEAAFASITPRKRERMINSVYVYLDAQELPAETDWRIDVIGIAFPHSGSPKIDHVENALDW